MIKPWQWSASGLNQRKWFWGKSVCLPGFFLFVKLSLSPSVACRAELHQGYTAKVAQIPIVEALFDEDSVFFEHSVFFTSSLLRSLFCNDLQWSSMLCLFFFSPNVPINSFQNLANLETEHSVMLEWCMQLYCSGASELQSGPRCAWSCTKC